MRILILGATGHLGSRLFKLFQQDGQIFGTYNLHKSSDENLMHWDGSNINELENLIENLNPIFVINCIGFAQVDLSEMFPEKAFMLNSILPYEIGRICYKSKVKLVHISTDHFNGHNTMALSEDDPVASPNIYSVSKLLGEKYVLNEDPSSIVVRANFFHFTKNSNNSFLDICINSVLLKESIIGFRDIFFSPVSTLFLKQCILKLIDINYSGLVNISSNEVISKYDFLKEIFIMLELEATTINSGSIFESNLLANRPLNMALSNKKYKELTKEIIPSLKEMIKSELIAAEITSL